MTNQDRGVQHAGNYQRSPHWEHVRDQFLKAHPKCAVCGATEDLEAHHVVPFHICLEVGRGYAELDPRNLITLCRSPRDCHLLLGHLDDFKSWNMAIRHVLHHFASKTTEAEVKGDYAWKLAHLQRPRPLDYQATDAEKAAIVQWIDEHYPVIAPAVTT